MQQGSFLSASPRARGSFDGCNIDVCDECAGDIFEQHEENTYVQRSVTPPEQKRYDGRGRRCAASTERQNYNGDTFV